MFHGSYDKILYCMKTDRGLCRNVNQDAVAAFTKGTLGLFVLSDGMGGHSMGELASQAIVEEFDSFWKYVERMETLPDFKNLVWQVQQVLLNANNRIYLQYNRGQVCGATVVVLLVMEDCYALFSVGDSHIYTCKGKHCSLLTVDDIWDMQASTRERYTEAEIAANESRGKLTQAMGTKLEVNLHVSTDRLAHGQVFLLCSDGLYKFCEEKMLQKGMRNVHSQDTMEKTMDLYIKQVFENGAADNVSAILVYVA